MAADLGRANPVSSKFDAFIASQLRRAEKRIRLLDLTAALLGFAALALAYVVALILCDSKLELSQHSRQLSLYAFLAGAGVYLFFTVVRPLRLRVNPYYAARQVEQLLPGAKNSIINWVDLHGQPLPPAIRGALGQRAAKDLSRVDLENAISGRRAGWAGGLAGFFAVAFIAAFFLLGPAPFFSLLKRAFNPFDQVGVSTRTQLVLLKPEGGNATVTVGRGVGFVVEVSGKVPDPKAADTVKLLYRHDEGDPWLERPLVPDAGREWTTALSAIEIKNGLWYKITGGDATTPEYHIGVRAAPAITDFLATYHFRPYAARVDEMTRERPLLALRGTEVVLRVGTNRTLREGRLELETAGGVKNLPGQPTAEDPRTLLFRFVLDESGKYRLHFYSTDNEGYSDPTAYPVTAIPDEKPSVELTRPGQDIRLPVNGLLHLEGTARDDIGVTDVTLRLQMVGGDKLQPRPYRSEDKLRLAEGGYPRELEYKDFVDLSKVKNAGGQPIALRPGMELEYWLEARDACDYPQPNPPGESKHYRVTLIEPEKNEPKRQQEKQQAEKKQKRHEEQQDKKLQQENQQRQQERKEQEAHNKEEQQKNQQGGQGAGENKAGQQNGGQGQDGGQGKTGQQDGGKPNNAEGAGNNGQGEANNGLSQEQQDIEKKVQDTLEKNEQRASGAGEGKLDKGDRGEGKGAKSGGPDDGKQPGENAANGEKPNAASQPSEGKSGGDSRENKTAGQGKPQPMGSDTKAGNGESKPMDPAKGQQAERKEGTETKNNSGGNTRSEPKGAGENKDGGKSEGKQPGTPPRGEPSASGEAKPSTPEGTGDKADRSEGKGEAGEQARKATSKDIEDLAKNLGSKDAQKREEAKRQLERIAEQAREAQSREKASEALQKAGQPDGPPDAKPPQPGKAASNNSTGERKDGQRNDTKTPSDSSAREGDKKPSAGDKQPGPKGERGPSTKDNKEGTRASAEGGANPGGGTQRRDGDNSGRTGNDATSDPSKSDKPRGHRATQMQLEDFAKKVNKDILKEAGVSEEAWKKYLEARRKQLANEKPRAETPAAPQQSLTLPSIGGRTLRPSSEQPGDLHGPDRGQPPPGYRDSFREFTRKMSKK